MTNTPESPKRGPYKSPENKRTHMLKIPLTQDEMDLMRTLSKGQSLAAWARGKLLRARSTRG